MHAILSVTAQGLRGSAEAAEVIVIDCSGSMGDYPGIKIDAAQRATCAAIDALMEGTWFAVVAGRDYASQAYPGPGQMVRATPATRTEAKDAVEELDAAGGTAMSTWLGMAAQLLDTQPTAVRHVLLLTDGINESEPKEALDRVLARHRGRFRCDARGIGDHWDPRELRRIVDAFLGRADAVRDESHLAADFTAIVEAAMGRVVPGARIRVRLVRSVGLRFLKQVHPTLQDLTPLRVPVDERTAEFPTGAWGDDHREYHLCVEVDAAGADMAEDLSAARVELVLEENDATVAGPVPVLVNWTHDLSLSIPPNSKVAVYTKQEELNEAMDAAYDAFKAGNRERAEAEWGRAVRLANEVGNEQILRNLLLVVDVEDPAAGRVKIKDHVYPVDLIVSLLSGVSTIDPRPVAARPDVVVPPGTPAQTCQTCGRLAWPDAVYCEACCHPLRGEAGPAPDGPA
jgi:hypothetical protein